MGRHGTIAGRKAAQDAKRAANFTKYARVITIAAKAGGDPDYNVALKHAIDRAKGINMPNDKIQKAIKKGTGELDGELLVEGSFEGYGAGGVAVIVDVLTDNNNRTTAFVKHAFDKYNGNLGKPGCGAARGARPGRRRRGPRGRGRVPSPRFCPFHPCESQRKLLRRRPVRA